MSPLAQLRALIRLRWRLVRSAALRIGLLSLALLVPLLAVLVLLARRSAEPSALVAAVHAAPAAFLGFGALAVVAPLSSSSGTELFPSDQLVAFPIRPGTMFLSSLVLAPLNLVWVLQLLVLTAETGFVAGSYGLLWPALVTSGCFVLAATAVGQALAWTAAGLRASARGRMVLRCALAALAVLGLAVVRSGHGNDVVAHSFAPWVVGGVTAGTFLDLPVWLPRTGLLLLVAALALLLGLRVCRWALQVPQELTARTGRPRQRRREPVDDYRALLAVDRASVWRAPALRRGALVLALLPGIAAAGVGLPWRSLVFLPGLVAAGGGLLFGFNAFCLDAAGAVWLASLPHPPALVARAKLRVTTEAVLLGAGLAAVIGAVRAQGTPTPTEVVAIICSTVACSLLVAALCLSSAVHRPHRADLNGPRDAVAPPGALVLTSIRLALPAALVGGLLEATAAAPQWWVPLLLALPVTVACSAAITRSLAAYDEPLRRSRIVQVVSAG